MAGISCKAVGSLENKKYRFQSQELNEDLGVNYYEFKWRSHDPQIGRFIQVDPLANKYVYNSTYAFSENKVTSHVELEGLEAISFINPNKNEHNKIIVNAANKNNDKSAIHIYAHGNNEMFYNEYGKNVQDQQISTGKALDRSLNNMSNEWKSTQEHSGKVVVLHACRTGKTTTDDKGNQVESVAQNISSSKEFKDVIIIAPTERDVFDSHGEIGPRVVKYTDANSDYKDGTPRDKEGQVTKVQGEWNVFKNGILIATFDGDWTPKGNPGILDNFLHKK